MRKKLLTLISIASIILSNITISMADNPIVQTVYTTDPAPMVYNDTLYVYTGHDEDNSTYFTMNDWRCYSTTDMANWTDHGSPLAYTDFKWASGDAWAGQVIYRNGKFYYYVPINDKALGRMAIGVAVSNSPTGPFTDALGKPLISYEWGDIDPTVFIDDDGQAYLYWGNPNPCYVKLNENMISTSGNIVKVPLTTQSFGVRSTSDRTTSYEEAPWFYKRNGLYYLAFAAGPISEHISYSTSNSPTGPWTYRGVIMPTQGGSFTNHEGIVDYKGNSYFFYHNGALPGGGGYTRSVCVEQFKYNTDGTIPTINMTKTGPTQIGTLNPFTQTEAETICWESGVETEKCSEGGMDVCNIENGDYIKIKGVNFNTGVESFDARVASATNGGNIEIHLDSPTGTLVGNCAVTGTGGWQAWTTKSCKVSDVEGIHDLYLKFTGASGSLFNFNWWKFNSSVPTTTPTPKPTPTATPTATATPRPTPTLTPTPTATPSPRSAFSQIEAEDFNSQSGIQTESCSEGGNDVGYIENGDYVVYNNINFGTGAESFEVRIASAASGGNIEIHLDSIDGPLLGTCPVTETSGWQTWATAKCNVGSVSGSHDLYLKFTGGSSYIFNLNWWKFNPISPVKYGDINGDGIININDCLIMKGYLLGQSTTIDLKASDLDGDSRVNSSDYALLKRYVLGTITQFPVSSK